MKYEIFKVIGYTENDSPYTFYVVADNLDTRFENVYHYGCYIEKIDELENLDFLEHLIRESSLEDYRNKK